MKQKIVAAILALCFLFTLCGCASEQEKSAKEGLVAILEGMTGKIREEETKVWVEDHFIDGDLTPRGMDLLPYDYIVFQNMTYKITSIKETTDGVVAEVDLTNAYLPMCLSYYWGYYDAEIDHVSDYESLMYESLHLCDYTYTSHASLLLKKEVKESDGSLGWGIVCDDTTVSSFFGDLYETDYKDNGYQYLVTENTFQCCENLANMVRSDLDLLNQNKSVKKTIEDLEQLRLQATYYQQLLDNCLSAYDYSQRKTAFKLMNSLCDAIHDAVENKVRSFDLEQIVDIPLQNMKNA